MRYLRGDGEGGQVRGDLRRVGGGESTHELVRDDHVFVCLLEQIT